MEHYFVRLDPGQRKNLLVLAEYLIRGELKARFDMRGFGECNEFWYTECGSVGCAVGHGPYAGVQKYYCESWADYSLRCFISDEQIRSQFLCAWDWCFGASWSECDNSPVGAARRIVYMLIFGVPSLQEEEAVPHYKRYIGNNWDYIITQFPELLSGETVERECPSCSL